VDMYVFLTLHIHSTNFEIKKWVLTSRKIYGGGGILGVVSKGTWVSYIIKQASLLHWVAEYNLKVSSVNYQKPRSPSKQHPAFLYNKIV